MKALLIICLVFSSFLATAKSLQDFTLSSAKEGKVELKKLNQGPLLIVNIATKCGYTPQLDDLEKLYQKFRSHGFTVIGVPSNDFGGQTPEDNKEVAKFCRLNYGVSFPLTEKIVVSGENKHPLYSHLINSSDKKEVQWNFEKFLFGPDGKFIARFPSKVEPMDKQILAAIEKTLKK